MAKQLSETDIDLVLVTGAGASHEFGANRQKLPLMNGWADFLVERLFRYPYFQEATGLRQKMSGPEFETTLGEFLDRVAGFYRAEGLIRISSQFALNPSIAETSLINWYRNSKSQFEQITGHIYGSLYDQFNDSRLNSIGAAAAYGELFQRLKISKRSRVVYATTNYDALGEQAFSELERLPDCGEPKVLGSKQNRLTLGDLLEGLPRYTPMLHLHGKVGWFRRADDPTAPVFIATPTYDANYGLPIVMLPHPQKSYEGDDVLSVLWTQFEDALRRAKRVFVLGHSLADQLLVKALVDKVQPPYDRVAVAVLDDGKGAPDPSAQPLVEWVRNSHPEWKMIPVRFGNPMSVREDTLEAWLTETKEHGIALPA